MTKLEKAKQELEFKQLTIDALETVFDVLDRQKSYIGKYNEETGECDSYPDEDCEYSYNAKRDNRVREIFEECIAQLEKKYL